MEILNSIWSALSTPNEIIMNIFFVFSAFFLESPLILSLVCNIFNLNPSKKEKLIFIIIFSLSTILGLFFIPSPFNTIINYIIMFLYFKLLLKINTIKSICMIFLPTICFTLLQSLTLGIYLDLFKITYQDVITIPIYRIPFLLFGYLILYILNIFIRNKIKNKKFSLSILDNIDKKNYHIIIINFLFGFLVIILQFILTITYIDQLSIIFSLANFICLLIYFFISIYSLTRVMKLVTTTQKLESAEEYNKTLHILHDSVRGFKHDFDNIVTTIGGYIKTNDMQGLKNYYTQLEDDCQKVNNLYVLDPDLINNPGVYNLITTKYNEAMEKGLKINLTFLLDLNELHMKIYEFTRILGILLDNAIEAASESDEKILYITFRKDFKNNMNLIAIENSYKDKNVNLDNIFSKGVSGKENHTGLGLWEVRQILKKNNNINLYTTKNNELFTQKLEIYY